MPSCWMKTANGMTYESDRADLQQILAGNTAVFIFPLCVCWSSWCWPPGSELEPLPLAVILIVPTVLFYRHHRGDPGRRRRQRVHQIGLIVLVAWRARTPSS